VRVCVPPLFLGVSMRVFLLCLVFAGVLLSGSAWAAGEWVSDSIPGTQCTDVACIDNATIEFSKSRNSNLVSAGYFFWVSPATEFVQSGGQWSADVHVQAGPQVNNASYGWNYHWYQASACGSGDPDPSTGMCDQASCPSAGTPAAGRYDVRAGGYTDLSGGPWCVPAPSGGGQCTVTQQTSASSKALITVSSADGARHVYVPVEYTGADCSGSPLSSGSGKVQTGANCITSQSGKEVCFNSAEKNCGTVNGQSVCVDSAPPGNCEFIGASDSMVCVTDRNNPTAAPNNQGGLGPTVNTYYQQDTSVVLSGDSYYGTQGTGTVHDNTGQPATQDGSETPDLNGDGLPDYGGHQYDGALGKTGLDGLKNGMQDGVDWDGPGFQPVLPEYAACQQITLTLLKHTVTIPNATWCGVLEQIKAGLAYLLYVMTVFYLIYVFYKSRM